MFKPLNIAITFTACLLVAVALSGVTHAEGVQVIHAYSGDTVELSEHTTPNTNVTVGVTRTITVAVADGRFSSALEGIYVPVGSTLSLKAWPVTALKVNGIVHESTFSSVREGEISSDTGTLLLNDIAEGDYDITIYGTSPANEISLTIVAAQNFTSDASGNYTASASSKGLPPGIYNITANGAHIADIYLEQRNIPTKTPGTGSSSNPLESPWLIGALIIITVAAFAFVAFDVFSRKRKKK